MEHKEYHIMKEEIIFGAAYYPEYMSCDRIGKDFEMMKKAGMNTVRIAESTWSTLEPQEGVFDFSYIDRVLDEAINNDMQVIVGTPTYAVPSWLVKKDPSIMVTTASGQAMYGRRQIMDITNEVYRQCAESVIRRLMEHVAGHPRVIGYQIDNETKHYGTSAPHVQELFVEYLKEKFHTVEELNKAYVLNYWSNAIASWEDFPDMRGCVNAGLAGEFAAFQRSLAAEFLVWQSNIVNEYKRDNQFITHNFDFEWRKFGADIAQDGYSYGVQPDICHYEASKAVTIVGTDIYHPTQDKLTGAEIAFCGDSIRSLKMSNYIVLECQAQAFKYWTPYPGQLRLHAYSHLASGADGIMYWNWHSIHNGYETYWKGLLSHDMDVNPTYEEAAVFGAEFKKLEKHLLHIKKKNKIALLVDNRSLTAFNWFPIDKDLSYNDVVRWMYDSLYELNLECDVVDSHAIEPEKYSMIVTPALYSADEKLIEKLDSFVKNGGVLVSSFKSFVADENLTVYDDAQPHGLTRCFGLTYNQFTNPGRTRVKGKPVQYFMELLKPEEAEVLANYEHRYWEKYAALTRNKYGNGVAYYIGGFLEKEELKKIYELAVSDAKIHQVFPSIQWPVIVRSGINGEGKKLHYIFNYSEDKQSVICPYEQVKDLLTGVEYKKDDTIILSDWNLVVLEE
jgi:beta-galactosidase